MYPAITLFIIYVTIYTLFWTYNIRWTTIVLQNAFLLYKLHSNRTAISNPFIMHAPQSAFTI